MSEQSGEPGEGAGEVDGLDGAAELLVIVEVTRTGGIAGIARTWRAAPAADAAPRWVELIERCPWDAPEPAAGDGADRFEWDIRAEVDTAAHSARLRDGALAGPWRVLVDEVRSEGVAVARPRGATER